MRPFRSFLILLVFLVCLTGLFYLFPDSKLFPSLSEFFPSLVTGNTQNDNSFQTPVNEHATDSSSTEATDSIYSADTLVPVPENKKPDPLHSFIDTLRESNNQTRIMYYGDSQVEGDRITFYLRQILREGRGGTGPGLFLPVMPVMYTKSIWLKSSPNWKRYNYLSYKTGDINHNRLGPFMTICRYLPEGGISTNPEKAFISIRPSNFADRAVAAFDVLRIFYEIKRGRADITIKADGNQIAADSLKNGEGLHEIDFSLGGAKDIQIEFESRVSPDIYGISIESRTGVIVDNIPQRGSAGLEFTMVDKNNLEDSYKILSPDLIILHYGLNIVKNVRHDYSYYRRGLYRQLMLLKEVAPTVPVIVVGVTDMASNEGDSIISYNNIQSIVKAQEEAAREAGTAFWDAYSAMGGKSSIIKWSKKKPPLAQKDYVHFTYPGADTLSRMLAEAMFFLETKDTILPGISENKSDTATIALTVPEKTSQPQIHEKGMIGSLVSQIFTYDPDKPFIFTTPAFWLFLFFVLAGYSLIYRKLFLRNFYLLLVSLFFYYKSGGLFLFLLIFVTVIDFTCGLLIYKSKKKSLKRLFILLSLISNLGILAYFKYTGFFVDTINNLFGSHLQVYDFLASFSNKHLGTSFNISNIILPVGISFFTFQSLSYTLDVYRGKLDPVRNIIDFGFYVSFFPQLVAGPIVRASEFIPQLYTDFSLTKREFSYALFMISKGLIKKIIISDFIATNFVDRVFDFPTIYSGFENLMAIYGYGLQIYCDFSGYTDIAIGLALIMGFRLPVNFNSPYKAAGISDFWKRWHISLSRWLKDYLYISLGGNRKGKIRTGINLLITMLLGGLWHGASLRFIIWGGLHGIGLVFNKIWNSIFGDRLKSGRFGRALAVFITFNFVSFCWIFFRAPDMNNAVLMLKQIGENFSPGSYLTVLIAYSSVFILMAVGYIIHLLPERIKESYRGLFIKTPLIAQLAVVMLIAVLLLRMRTTDIMPFIYFRF
jgi:D-alanyl-lipoteichoic acid acyltransferase DltB (MBOAT superfamily)